MQGQLLKMHQGFLYGVCILGLMLVTRLEAKLISSENSLVYVQEVLRNVDPVPNKLVEQTGCSCVDYNCGCCLDLDVPEIKLKDLTCINITYLPDEYGVRLTFSINKYVLINVTVSAKNPPPICFGIPYLEGEASACIDLYNLDVQNKTFSGCVKLSIRLLHVVILDENFGCFHFPLLGQTSVVHAKLMVESLDKNRLKSYLPGV